jgi:hypothetical protein
MPPDEGATLPPERSKPDLNSTRLCTSQTAEMCHSRNLCSVTSCIRLGHRRSVSHRTLNHRIRFRDQVRDLWRRLSCP